MNLFVAPSPANTLGPREAELACEFAAGGFRPPVPPDGPALRLEIPDAGLPGAAAELAAWGRELTAAWNGIRGILPQFETAPVERATNGPVARDAAGAPWSPETGGIGDLDGPGVHAALRKILAEPGDSSGIRIAQRPAAGGTTLVVVAVAGTERFCARDARCGGGTAVTEAVSELTCAGATPVLLVVEVKIGNVCPLDDFHPFADSLLGIAEAVRALDVPVFTIIRRATVAEAAPIVAVSGVGRIAGRAEIGTTAVVNAETRLILLGEPPRELGGSRFLAVVHGKREGAPPALDLPAERRLQTALVAMRGAGLLAVAQPVTAGGLTLAAGELLLRLDYSGGVRLDLTPLGGGRTDALLFGEHQGCVIAAVASERAGSVLAEAHMRGVPATVIGKFTDEPVLGVKARSLAVEWTVAELREIRQTARI